MEYEFFKETELRCKCECNRADMNADFMESLIDLRRALRIPFVLTSAFRCPEYNNKVSGTGTGGPHTLGRAVDIKVYGARAFYIVSLAHSYGFTGIGVSQKGNQDGRFIHLDNLDWSIRPWVWSY